MELLSRDDVVEQIKAALIESETTKGNRYQQPVPPRPILSSLDVYQPTQPEQPTNAFTTGVRPLWGIPPVAVVTSKITTIKTSVSVSTATSPILGSAIGIVSSPVTNSTSFSVIPNMAQSIRTSGPVNVSFSLNAQTSNASDPVSFAIFRDGQQISQIYRGSGAATTDFHMAGSYTDTPPIGLHVYDVRWKKGSSQATASGKNRTLQVSNLRAQ